MDGANTRAKLNRDAKAAATTPAIQCPLSEALVCLHSWRSINLDQFRRLCVRYDTRADIHLLAIAAKEPDDGLRGCQSLFVAARCS